MDDTWHVAIGAQYRIAEPWLLSIGFAYDSSPFDHAEDRTPDMPLDRQIRYATGLQYDWNGDVTVGAVPIRLSTPETLRLIWQVVHSAAA